jgi:hypothetical protein
MIQSCELRYSGDSGSVRPVGPRDSGFSGRTAPIRGRPETGLGLEQDHDEGRPT